MISVFRNNDIINFFLLFPYAIILRLHSLIHPEAYVLQDVDTSLMTGFFNWVQNPLIQSIIAILLVFAQGVMINLIANNHRLHRLPSALAGMVYILLASTLPEFQTLTPALIGMTFVLYAIMNVFRTYNQSLAAESIFNATLSAAVASICYVPYISVIIALFIGLTMMRNFRSKEKLQFIIGYGVTFWIIGSFLYYSDLLRFSFLDQINFPGSFSSMITPSMANYINWAIVIVFLLIALFNYYNFMKKKGIEIRKKIDFFYWLMLSGLIALLLFRGEGYQLYFFLITPLALFLSMGILMIRNRALAELFHIFALVGIFYLHFS